MEGAAWASDFSMLVSCIWNVICAHLILKKKTQAKMYFSKTALKEYLQLALPTILQSSVLSVGTMVLQVIVNQAGIEYINGYTVATTIFNLLLLPIVATSVGFETFASQNIGAKAQDRVREGYYFLIKEGVVVCIVLTVIDIFFSGTMMSIYSLDVTSSGYAFATVSSIGLITMAWALLFGSAISAAFDIFWKKKLSL